MSVYTDNGYDSRKHYLECLAEDFGLKLSTVHTIALVYGSNEDFDGLVTACEDVSGREGY
ncbi:hypothetical protein NSQ62_08060 [Solibacillus sp. FSL H8-0523]|uniref:hypothetical protein n=1 Tax=Solibacillus sp. FSL H8-0523 TaxID=2954511 RepID=UPI00310154CD